jgi:glycosyltransferase involved in cell wall biosynthesis
MTELPKICIIGPSVNTDAMGGVATHIGNLKSLECLYDAAVIDPGSVNSNLRTSRFRIAKAIVGLRKTILRGDYSHVFVNTSIYPSSFIKLLGILAFLPSKKDVAIHVFFHGGRFQAFGPVLAALFKLCGSHLMLKARKCHFLSVVQMEGFRMLFHDSEADLYSNYSVTDEIWQKKRELLVDGLNLLFVGRVVREKGIFELLSAIEKISKEEENIRLTIAGDGPDLPGLIERTKMFPRDLVHFTGHLAGSLLEDVYRTADVVVLPTYHPEGFPYTFIEAMRAGVPIISTGEGALDFLVQDGVTGFKVQPKDVDTIVMAIRRVMRNKPLLEEMSKSCHSYFREKLSRSAAEKYYSELIKEGPL